MQMDAVVRARLRTHMSRYNIVGRLALEEIFASNELDWNLFACNF